MKFSKTFQRFLWAYVAFSGLNGIRMVLTSFSHPDIYRKDFVSGYLLAQALYVGVDPYQDLSVLAQQLALNSPIQIFPHPTPHPVPLGLLALPLCFWGFDRAAQLWCLFEILCLTVSLVLLARWWQGDAVKYKLVFLCGWVLLGWGPVTEDLWAGQFNPILLLVLLLAWQALRQGQEIKGGVWLGCALAFKLMAWPVVLFLLWRRRWRSVLATGLTGLGFHLLSASLIGFAGLLRYYTKAGPTVSALYREVDANYSASSFGWRLFADTTSAFYVGNKIAPLMHWPAAAKLCSILFPLLVLAFGLWLAHKCQSFDTAFALLLCISLLVNPVAWNHYFVLLLLPLAILARRLQQMDFPPALTLKLAIFWLVASPSPDTWRQLAAFFQSVSVTGERPTVPFAAGLLMFTYAFALFGLMTLLWRSEQPAQLAFASQQTQPGAPQWAAAGD
jgi:hypothetical protein